MSKRWYQENRRDPWRRQAKSKGYRARSAYKLKQIQDKYADLVNKNEGKVIKTESWGLLNLAYLIKKNKKGNYIHFKIEGNGKTISELEKNEKIDKNLLRYLTVKVKKLDLNTNYFEKKIESTKEKTN